MDEKKSLHETILTQLREELQCVLLSKVEHPEIITAQDVLPIIFKNYRYKNNQHQGLRLTYLGNRLLSKHFDSHTYMYEGTATHKTLILLDKNMMWPYYVSKSIATFYSESDAAWFKLNGSNINDYTEYL